MMPRVFSPCIDFQIVLKVGVRKLMLSMLTGHRSRTSWQAFGSLRFDLAGQVGQQTGDDVVL